MREVDMSFDDALAMANETVAHNKLAAIDSCPRYMLLPSNNTTITESAESIFSAISQHEDMFIFGGVITEVVTVNSAMELSQISSDAFRSRIEGYGLPLMSYVDYKGDYVLKSKLCSSDSSKALMASHVTRKLLPHVRSVVSCPVLTHDLEVLNKGYHDRLGGILVANGKHVEAIAIDKAVEALIDLLSDNKFATESDKSRALSMIIQPMMKMGGFITSPCPIDVAEANDSQSGKTYRQKVIAAIYNESPVVVTPKTGGVGSVDESIASALATGRPFVQLDNFRGNFNSPMFEAVITSPESVPVRVPRREQIIIDARSVSFQMSSNGVDTTLDLANRSCVIRIRKEEGKQWRKYPEGDLLDHVRENQHFYLGCVMSVIKEWVKAEKPMSNTVEHDMRAWAQTMDWIVQNIFKSAPLLDGHRAIQNQVSSPNLTWFREVCIAAERDDKLSYELLAHNIVELCEQEGIEYPNKRKYHSDDAAFKYVGVIMGKLFGKNNSLKVDCYNCTKSEAEIYNENSGRHLMSKIYQITVISE